MFDPAWLKAREETDDIEAADHLAPQRLMTKLVSFASVKFGHSV